MKIILQEGKMIRCVFATFAILIALSACTPATQATLPSVISNSATPSPIPTATQTFDASTILTVTPAPKAGCPAIKESPSVDLTDFDDYYPELIAALNQGSSIEAVITVFAKQIDEFYFPNSKVSIPLRIRYEVVDVTNDGVQEILLPGSISFQP